MQNLPIGLQSFEWLRRDGYLYVDKTDLLYQLVTTGKYYFLSRPRRFGKSLTIHTLKAYFQGKKQLFEGLAIEHLEKEWRQHPVLLLDFNTGEYGTMKGLEESLETNISKMERELGVVPPTEGFSTRFRNVIETAYEQTGERVVLLVDEYDKPLIKNIDNPELQDRQRELLKSVYSVVKTCDEQLRFAILTGVTKFSKVSIFSDLNNLNDISIEPQYAALCGLTRQEIVDNMSDHIAAFAKQEGTDVDTILQKMKEMYDGYHFSSDLSVEMYNPFSVINTLTKKRFLSEWFETGTPSFLVKLLRQNDYDLRQFCEGELTAQTLSSKETLTSEPIALFYQTGYLTIKNYDREFDTYSLGFPNKEVAQGFLNMLLPSYTNGSKEQSPVYIQRFVKSLRVADIDGFMKLMKSFFASTPYDLIRDTENHYQTVMYIISRLMGYYTEAEYRTSDGRIDMTIATADYRYIFEFKFGGTAEEALAQIDSKDYALPFAADPVRKTYKIGVNFSKETRNIDTYLIG